MGLCLILSPAYALPLCPGCTVAPVTLLPGTTSFPLGSPNGVSSQGSTPFFQGDGAWSVAGQSNSGSVDFDSAVFIDPVTHNLDFFYQIQNVYNGATTTTDTLGNYTGVNPNPQTSSYNLILNTLPGVTIMQVAQISPGNWNNACVTPTMSNPNPPVPCPDDFVQPKPSTTQINSVTLAFDPINNDFDDLQINMNSPLAPGQDSAILVIKTNANDFDQNGFGDFAWQTAPTAPAGKHLNGVAKTQMFSLGTLEPILTPEPGVYGVLSLALAGVLLLARRRSDKAKVKSADATVV